MDEIKGLTSIAAIEVSFFITLKEYFNPAYHLNL